jgi:phenylalanyl-tRNA synthetase beta chain
VGNQKPSDKELAELYAATPHQPWHVAGVFLGNQVERSPGRYAVPSGIADALDAARVVARAASVSVHVHQATHPAFHPGRYAELHFEGSVVGCVGEVLPQVARARDLPSPVSVFSLDVDQILALRDGSPHTAYPISIYPAATQDVSLVVAVDIPASSVRDSLVQGCGELLEGIHLVDDYRGEGIEDGYRSLTFALRFRASDRTLTQAEATTAKDSGVAAAQSLFGAIIRA